MAGAFKKPLRSPHSTPARKERAEQIHQWRVGLARARVETRAQNIPRIEMRFINNINVVNKNWEAYSQTVRESARRMGELKGANARLHRDELEKIVLSNIQRSKTMKKLIEDALSTGKKILRHYNDMHIAKIAIPSGSHAELAEQRLRSVLSTLYESKADLETKLKVFEKAFGDYGLG